MTIPKKYVHDKTVLLLLGVNIILLLTGILLVLFKMDSGRGSGYIIEYRSSLSIGDFKTGSAFNMLGFVFFLAATFAIDVLLSIRIYAVRRHVAVAVLSMGIVLSLLTIIVSNALLVLR